MPTLAATKGIRAQGLAQYFYTLDGPERSRAMFVVCPSSAKETVRPSGLSRCTQMGRRSAPWCYADVPGLWWRQIDKGKPLQRLRATFQAPCLPPDSTTCRAFGAQGDRPREPEGGISRPRTIDRLHFVRFCKMAMCSHMEAGTSALGNLSVQSIVKSGSWRQGA